MLIIPLVYGGAHAYDLDLNPESSQEGSGEIDLTVTLNTVEGTVSSSAVTVPLAFVDDSTTAADYSVTGNLSVTVPANATQASTVLKLTPTLDGRTETRTETVLVQGAANNAGETFVRPQEFQIIDSPVIRLSVMPTSLSENGGAQSLTVTAALGDPNDTAFSNDVPISLRFPAGSGTDAAIPGRDFVVPAATTLTLPANQRSASATVMLTPTDDNLFEGPEKIRVAGTAPFVRILGAEVTLTDNETVPEVVLSLSDDVLVESDAAGTAVTVTATLRTAEVTDEVLVTLDLGGSATEGSTADYTASWSPSSRQIRIPAGTLAGTAVATLTPVQDSSAEGTETIVFEGTAARVTAGTALVMEVATAQLRDDDVRGVIARPATLTLQEGVSGTLALRLATEPTGDVTVSLSAPQGQGVTLDETDLTFTPTDWETEQSVTVSTQTDNLINPMGRRELEIELTVGGADYADHEAEPVALVLIDADSAPVFSTADAAADEGDSVQFTVMRLGVTSPIVTVDWATADDTATAGSDYTASSGTLTFAAGETVKTISVQTAEDTADESDETFKLQLSNPTGSMASIAAGSAEVLGTIQDANAPPTFTAGETATRSVAENTAAGTNIGAALAATDTDTADTLTYTLGGANAAAFEIVATSGQLQTKTGVSYDHETKDSYAVTVSVSDGQGGTDSVAVTISVTDVDEPPATPAAPTVTAASRTSLSVSWAAPTNTGKPPITDYDVQYRTGTDDYAAWTHTGTSTSATITGLTHGTSYDVQVKAKNAEGESGWSAAGSGSTSANSAPTFTAGETATRSVAENTAGGTNIGAALAATDTDTADTLTYTLGGANAAAFEIVATSGQLQTKTGVSYDHETKDSYAVTVSVSDGQGGTDSVAVTISVTDVDEPPATPAAPTVTAASRTSLSVSWAAPTNTGKPPITDYDVQYRTGTDDYAAWAHAGTSTSATITGLTHGTSYDVQVKAKNAEGESGWSAAGSGSTSANSAPTFTAGETATRSVAENTAADTNIGAALAATDTDTADTLTYTLGGANAAAFQIVSSSGQLQTKAGVSYDHETKDSYAVTVSVSDGQGGTDSVAVTISVTDVNEPPAAPAAPTVTAASRTSLSVSWAAPTNTGKPPITDYDVQYRTGADDYAAWAHAGTSTSATITGLTHGTSYDVQVKAKNAEGESGWSAAGSGSTSANSAPTFTAGETATRSVAENTAADTNIGAALAATDTDTADTLTYTLGGANAAAFQIVSSSGQLQTKAGVSYDHETKDSYAVTVSVSDGQGGTDSVAVTISVTDVDEPPATPAAPTVTAASRTSLSVSWAAPTNTGKPPITDYDVQYRTGADDYAAWAHSGTATGATITGLLPGTSYDVQVKAKNAEGESGWSTAGSGSPTANNAPVFTAGATATRSVAENTAAGTNIGAALAATDGDAADTLTYTLGGDDAASFEIVATSGQLQTKSALDHEAKDSYAVTVGVEDDLGASDSIAVTINVTDVDEPPAAPAAPMVGPASRTSLSVSWSPPTNTGKPPITDYDLQYRTGTDDYAAWAHSGTATSATITGLLPGTSYDVQVKAKNAEGESGWSTAGSGSPTANNAPVFTAGATATRSVAENTAAGANIGAALAATDADAADTLTYTLGGDDAASFEIVATSGQLQTKSALDHEAKDSYAVTVGVEDDLGASDSIAVTISVTDVNEPPATPAAPTVTAASRTSLSVSWAAPTNTGKPPITDYNVQYRTGTDDYAAWTHTGTGTSATITGLTHGTSYDVQVKAKNAEGESGWSAAGSGSTSANSAPTFTAGETATRSVAENTAADTNIGAALAATDTDTADTLTYTLGGANAAAFQIVASSGQLQTKAGVSYDHETKDSYAVTVSVSDGQGGTDSVAVTISVTDVDEPPATPAAPTVTAASRTSLSVSWAAPANMGKPPITDYDVQYRTGADAYAAWAHSGTATSATITGLLPGTSYDVQVKAKNAEGESDWSTAGSGSPTANNAPVFTAGATATRSVAENTAADTNIGAALAATDADAADTLTYTLGGDDAASFEIVATSGQLQTKAALDHEAKDSYAVTVGVEDDLGASDSIAVTINVTDVNEPPAAPAAPTVGPASRTSLSVSWSPPTNTGKPPITDYDVQYRTGTDDYAAWTHTGTSASATITGLTPGTSYDVQVKAKNAEGESGWSTAGSGSPTANSAPVFTAGATATRSVAENTAAGTNIGAALAATDADAADTLTYTLGGDDAASFEIVATSGQLQTKAALDHEAKDSYAVTVGVEDDLGASDSIAVTINVTDVNEPPAAPAAPTVGPASRTSLSVSWAAPTNTGKPPITDYDVQYRTGTDAYAAWTHTGTSTSATITGLTHGTSYDVQVKAKNAEGESGWSTAGSGSPTANNAPAFTAGATATRSVAENTAAGTNIGAALAATDADAADTLTYTLGGTDAASFEIVATSGQLQTKSALDHEAKASYAVTVGVEDDLGASDSIAVTINVTDVNEPPAAPAAPTVGPASRTSLSVSWAAPTNTGKPPITDYDVQYRTGTDAYAAWTHTGTSTSATITGLTHGTSYDVQVKAKNAEGESGWSTAGSGSPTANNAPAFTAGATATRSVAENTAAGTNIGAALAATDADAADTLTYTLGGTDAASFEIVATSGQLQTKSALDHEAKASYAVTVGVEDDLGASDSIAVTINVTDVNEPPAAPAAPTVAAASRTSLSVSWAAPTNTGKPAISDYDLQYRTGTDSYAAWPHTGTTTSATITGLDPNTSYDVQVKARNDEGESGWSAAGSGTTSANPADPEFSLAGASAVEGRPAVFSLTRSDAAGAVSASWEALEDPQAEQPATAGEDFVAASGTISFEPGQQRATFAVQTLADRRPEPPESFLAEVRVAGTALRATGTIRDPAETTSRVASEPGMWLWTDAPGYLPGDSVRLHLNIEPNGQEEEYSAFVYRVDLDGGQRVWLELRRDQARFEPGAVDIYGESDKTRWARRLERVDRQLKWQGPVPEPGPWHFVAELRSPTSAQVLKRAYAKYLVAGKGTVLVARAGIERRLRGDERWASDTIRYLGGRLVVPRGATLEIEAGTQLRAWGPGAEIVVEAGGRIVARGRRDNPIVMTCSSPVGSRERGCWGGLRIFGEAQPGVPAAEGSQGAGNEPGAAARSSGELRYVRVEFAGGRPDGAGAAVSLHRVGAGTVLENVQAHASLGPGFRFEGGTVGCYRCVASNARQAGVLWEGGFRGLLQNLYVQQADADAPALRGIGQWH